MSLDHLRSLVEVCGRETQQPEAGVQQQVLTAVVLDQSIAMIGAVVLDDEPGLPVVQIGPADKPRIGIAELDLNFGAR